MKFDDIRARDGKLWVNGQLYAVEVDQSSIDAQDARRVLETGQRKAYACGRQAAEEEARAIIEPNLDDLAGE